MSDKKGSAVKNSSRLLPFTIFTQLGDTTKSIH